MTARLRVLRVLSRPNLGGPTIQALHLDPALRELGVDTLLAVGSCGPDEQSVDLDALGAISIEEALAAGEHARGVVVIPGLGRRPGFAQLVGLAGMTRTTRTLRSLAHSLRPDVIHTHTSGAGFAVRGSVADVPLVHTYHGHVLRDYFPPLLTELLTRRERALAKRTDQLLAISRSCADELAALNIALRERFADVAPAVAAARRPVSLTNRRAVRDAMRARLGIADSTFAITCVARLVPIKRVHLLLDAIRLAEPTSEQPIVVKILGDGPLRDSLQAAAPPNVEFLGAVEDAASLLPAFDAVVLPSRREGFPLVAMEAAAARTEFVGFDVPGVADAVADLGGYAVPEARGAVGLAAVLGSIGRRNLGVADAIASGPVRDVEIENDAHDEPWIRNARVVRELDDASVGKRLQRFSPEAVAVQLHAIYRQFDRPPQSMTAQR